MKTRLVEICKIDVPNTFFDYKISLCPSGHETLKDDPVYQSRFDKIINKIEEICGHSYKNFITIDSKFFPEPSSHRREGLHIDGNFCGDIEFSFPNANEKRPISTWGGKPTWGGSGRSIPIEDDNGTLEYKGKKFSISVPWVSAYGVKIEWGKYVSDYLGGIFMASTDHGCEVYEGEFDPSLVGDGGSLEKHRSLIRKTMDIKTLKANTLYFMTSNSPHEGVIVPAGVHRTLIRYTLDKDFDNRFLC